ncbi:MAG: methyltransferase domain-containing protein [Ktedonobacteraceae bacterium]
MEKDEVFRSQVATKNVSAKKTPIQERAITVGDFVVINAYGVNRVSLKHRFAEGGYLIQETVHFLLFLRDEAPGTIIVHWFAPEEINSDVSHYLVRELKPFGILTHSQHFGQIQGGIVGSLFPDDVRRAWRFFGENTLQRLLTFMATAYTPSLLDYATIGMFATLYQRVLELRVGPRLLDAGCASGFLPLIVSERVPFLTEVTGVDIQQEAFEVAQKIAEEQQLQNVKFAQANLLSDGFCQLGCFDTVVALHVLEHLTEEEMYQALKHLLAVTSQRLIVAVPYEGKEPELAYGHQQVFSRAKLESVGNWCLKYLGGSGRKWCEDCVGGLLLIERCS